jgi:hypothetical protein
MNSCLIPETDIEILRNLYASNFEFEPAYDAI